MAPSNPRFTSPAPPRESDPFDGVLLVDKPRGPTSHDIVDAVRGHFRIRKVGHGGTLDPMATGLLILLTGRGTKLSNYFLGGDKTYVGTMRLGVSTNSYDADGEVVSERDPSGITREALAEQMASMTGDSMQTPPMVSAVKVDGVPLYKSARKGKNVERKARLIHLYEFKVLDIEPPEVDFRVSCTKGTYVRSLCHDVGEALGCGAHLSMLRRTRCGKLDVKDAIDLKDLLELDESALRERIIPVTRFPGQRPRPGR